MKCFVFEYNSEGNLFKGEIVINAQSLPLAQTAFLNWVQKQDVYRHMWRLSFSAKEVSTL